LRSIALRSAAAAALAALLPTAAISQAPDNATLFGARPAVEHVSLSPDGTRIAFVTPGKGQASALHQVGTDGSAQPKPVFRVDGAPERLSHCNWVSNARLACTVYGVANDGKDIIPFNRKIAIGMDGSNAKLLSKRENASSYGRAFFGGGIVDWLPETEDQVMMTRVHLPDDRVGSLVGSRDGGLAVEKIDTSTLKAQLVERPDFNVVEYISDGRGTIRIKGVNQRRGDGYDTGITSYYYRAAGSKDWQRLSDYNSSTDEGFNPYAVDPVSNSVYGFERLKGRMALYKITLDGAMARTPVLSRDDVDVDGLVQIGRHQRVVGASYATDIRNIVYFDPEISKLHKSLSKALPGNELIYIVDTTTDEQKILIWAGSDDSAGTYYLLDRTAKSMSPLLAVRPELQDVKLATVKPIQYPAADGTMIPGYLTLPPGSDGKNLPAIVLPHGGPSARDEWGFDWLSQFYAAQGYAVLQPNFRGSSGYGDAWFQDNGFRSWKTAIGDVQDAGRWMVKQGIADPKKLGIVGWSYGGYAALQSAVTDPGLFKAVVAIAPVTDLDRLRQQTRNWSNRFLASDFIGGVEVAQEASPTRHAQQIKAPVLMFHGGLDRNVHIDHSKMMATRLQSAGVPNRLITWDNLDHYLEDSDARITMLRTSDEWLKAAFAGKPAPQQ
jgi:dipeptidyl aminopeptidase/acylaminoacyl peptidase